MDTSDIISLMVLTPERTVCQKMVSKVSLPGTLGRFMVLRNHAPLISSLEEGRIIYVSDSVEGNIDIAGGFVEIADNKVIVCAEL